MASGLTQEARGDAPRPAAFAPAFLRALGAWLVLVALIVQSSAVPALADSGITRSALSFPICHAPGGEPPAIEGRRTPVPAHHPASSHDSCPFCSTCCHLALVLPTSVGITTPTTVARVEARRVRRRVVALSQPRQTAWPRGPPSA